MNPPPRTLLSSPHAYACAPPRILSHRAAGPTNCDCKGGVEDECGDCGGSGKLDKCGICDGPGIPLGFCDCDGHVMDECNVCGGTGKPEGACDCAGNHIDACGDCGGPGLALDNAEWKDTYGDSCERYHGA